MGETLLLDTAPIRDQRTKRERAHLSELPCIRCGGAKPKLTPRTRKPYPYSYCLPCRSELERERSTPEVVRDRALRRMYGITLEEFNRILEEQNGRCVICGSTAPRGRGSFAVDHDHETGRVRGLLCHPCNAGLGQFGDTPGTLRLAAAYLERQHV